MLKSYKCSFIPELVVEDKSKESTVFQIIASQSSDGNQIALMEESLIEKQQRDSDLRESGLTTEQNHSRQVIARFAPAVKVIGSTD